MSILGVICGADNWIEISEFGRSREGWLREFLDLPHGIPSHDTLGRVFSLLDAEVFEVCFSQWAHSLPVLMQDGVVQKEVIAIYGKTSRRTHNCKKDQMPLHMVSVWATNHGLSLGQVSMVEVKCTVNHETVRLVRYFLTSLSYPLHR